jgi:hypothetical protein
MAATAVAVFSVALLLARSGHDRSDVVATAATTSSSVLATTSTSSTTSTTEAPATTVAPQPATTATTRAPAPRKAVPATTAAPRKLVVGAAALPRSAAAYEGLGAWVDCFDWSATYSNNNPQVGPADVDKMAGLGVQTLYIQTSRADAPTDVLEPERLQPIIDRARQRGIRVVSWYLPNFEDQAADVRRMVAAARLSVQSFAVDIESTKIGDAAERGRRLVQESAALRQQLGADYPIGAIVLPPVATEVINPNYWPGFPYREIAPLYNAWMVMDYFTNRTAAQGYRDAYRYTAENIDRLRNDVGVSNLPVHSIGGIADKTTPEDVDGMWRASSERGSPGGSLYDYRTTGAGLWPGLQRFRR